MAGRAALFLGIKYATGDVIVQRATKEMDQIDYKRASVFWAFGTYYGVINYGVFYALSRSPWPTGAWSKAVFSALCDGFLNVPIGFYPQFYFVKEMVASPNWREKSLGSHFGAGMAKYRENIKADVMASAGVFVPLGILNFRFVPLRWRTPVLSVTGLVFPIILSLQRGASVTDPDS